MSSNYKQDETQLSKILQDHISSSNADCKIKLTAVFFLYKTKKLSNVLIRNKPSNNSDIANPHHVAHQFTSFFLRDFIFKKTLFEKLYLKNQFTCSREGCYTSQNNCYIGHTSCTVGDRLKCIPKTVVQ